MPSKTTNSNETQVRTRYIEVNDIKRPFVSYKDENSEIVVKCVNLNCLNPEEQAALGALTSRDPGPIENKIEKITINDIESVKRLMQIYIGYNHGSIGDMGILTISIEDLSMICGFNLIGHPLFVGQEASTRYIDWSKASYIKTGIEDIDKLSEQFFVLYNKATKYLMEKYEKDRIPEKERKPKIFDQTGALLPFSAKTSIYWVTSIRNILNQIKHLRGNKGFEEKILSQLLEKIVRYTCPNTLTDNTEIFNLSENDEKLGKILIEKRFLSNSINTEKIHNGHMDMSKLNKEMIEIVKKFSNDVSTKSRDDLKRFAGLLGTITATFDIDFRSIRDINRHRSFSRNTVVYPLINKNWEIKFEQFYIKDLNSNLKDELDSLLQKACDLQKKHDIRKLLYCLPMGVKVPCILSGDFFAWAYFLDQRTGIKVHPTVRTLALSMAEVLERKLDIKIIPTENWQDSTNYSKRSRDENKI